MTELDELIGGAANGDREAIGTLVAGGPPALRAVLDAVTAGEPSFEPGLLEVVRRSDYPEAEAVLREHVGAKSGVVVQSVMHALARTGEPGLRLVVERLSATDEQPTTRAFAAEALYGSTAEGVADALHSVLREQRGRPDDPELPLLLVNSAVALATLGDHSGAPALYEQLEAEEQSARALAVKAFRVVVDDETYRRLERAAADDGVEVRRAVVDPLFLLGSPAAAALLLRLAGTDDDGQVAGNATVRFGNIMGLELSGVEDLDFARDEWETERDGLDASTCYRFGEPLTLPNLVEEFTEEERLRDDVGAELRFVTGVDVPAIYAAGGVEAVQEALGTVEIEPGRLYKWGRTRPMPSAS